MKKIFLVGSILTLQAHTIHLFVKVNNNYLQNIIGFTIIFNSLC